jgi:hypothetical protein
MSDQCHNFEKIKIIYKKGVDKDLIENYSIENDYHNNIEYLDKIKKNTLNYIIFHILSIIIININDDCIIRCCSFLPYEFIILHLKKYFDETLFIEIEKIICDIEKITNDIVNNYSELDQYKYCYLNFIDIKEQFNIIKNNIKNNIKKNKQKMANYLIFFVKKLNELNMKNRMNIISLVESIIDLPDDKIYSNITKYLFDQYALREICTYIDIKEYGNNIINESELYLFESLPFEYI